MTLGDADQISRSNSTLNTFLGGRMPLWAQGSTTTTSVHKATLPGISTSSKTSRKRRADGTLTNAPQQPASDSIPSLNQGGQPPTQPSARVSIQHHARLPTQLPPRDSPVSSRLPAPSLPHNSPHAGLSQLQPSNSEATKVRTAPPSFNKPALINGDGNISGVSQR